MKEPVEQLNEAMARTLTTDDECDEVFGEMKVLIRENPVLINQPTLGPWIKENQAALVEWGKRRRGEV